MSNENINKIIISELFNNFLKTTNDRKYICDIINLLLVFENGRKADVMTSFSKNEMYERQIIFKNILIDNLNRFINLDEEKIIFAPHFNQNLFNIIKKKYLPKIEEINEIYKKDNIIGHSKFGEILGYYCFKEEWFNSNKCRVQLQINIDKTDMQITTEACEFERFKTYNETYIAYFINKLNLFKSILEKYNIIYKLEGTINFLIGSECNAEYVNNYIEEFKKIVHKLQNIYNIRIGKIVKYSIDGKKIKKRKSKKTKRKSKKSYIK